MRPASTDHQVIQLLPASSPELNPNWSPPLEQTQESRGNLRWLAVRQSGHHGYGWSQRMHTRFRFGGKRLRMKVKVRVSIPNAIAESLTCQGRVSE
jgi:hypothetical protein